MNVALSITFTNVKYFTIIENVYVYIIEVTDTCQVLEHLDSCKYNI